ncbi:hypothetical protein CHCC20375_2265 [Bacillus licheniformis]|nr:hypothetical protein CHCC20375_2265 [Bacillus licheniformis]
MMPKKRPENKIRPLFMDLYVNKPFISSLKNLNVANGN